MHLHAVHPLDILSNLIPFLINRATNLLHRNSAWKAKGEISAFAKMCRFTIVIISNDSLQ